MNRACIRVRPGIVWVVTKAHRETRDLPVSELVVARAEARGPVEVVIIDSWSSWRRIDRKSVV